MYFHFFLWHGAWFAIRPRIFLFSLCQRNQCVLSKGYFFCQYCAHAVVKPIPPTSIVYVITHASRSTMDIRKEQQKCRWYKLPLRILCTTYYIHLALLWIIDDPQSLNNRIMPPSLKILALAYIHITKMRKILRTPGMSHGTNGVWP